MQHASIHRLASHKQENSTWNQIARFWKNNWYKRHFGNLKLREYQISNDQIWRTCIFKKDNKQVEMNQGVCTNEGSLTRRVLDSIRWYMIVVVTNVAYLFVVWCKDLSQRNDLFELSPSTKRLRLNESDNLRQCPSIAQLSHQDKSQFNNHSLTTSSYRVNSNQDNL